MFNQSVSCKTKSSPYFFIFFFNNLLHNTMWKKNIYCYFSFIVALKLVLF